MSFALNRRCVSKSCGRCDGRWQNFDGPRGSRNVPPMTLLEGEARSSSATHHHASPSFSTMRIVLIPGMGCTPVASSNWYSWFANEMNKRDYVEECILRDFPDPHQCKESIWIPFLQNEVGLDESTVVVGHSSGAACAMRVLENENCPRLLGAILVAAAYTDLGDEHEAKSEYFNRPWDWDKMKEGAKNIVLLHGTDDHLIPVREARYIASKMNDAENFQYVEMDGVSHFFSPWQELLDVMDAKFGKESIKSS